MASISDEDDERPLVLLEQVPLPGRANVEKELAEHRHGAGEERHAGLPDEAATGRVRCIFPDPCGPTSRHPWGSSPQRGVLVEC